MILTVYAPNLTMAIIYLTISNGFSGIPVATYCANMMDISTKTTGMIMAIANTFATISGIIAPILTSRIIKDDPTMFQWKIVFIISSGILIIPSTLFLCIGRTEIQSKL